MATKSHTKTHWPRSIPKAAFVAYAARLKRACPDGCYWVDAEQTICSACLEPVVSPETEVAHV